MTTYFVRTRHHYLSYDDFFMLAALSGYPVIYIDQMAEVDRPEVTFIISPVNGEWNRVPRGVIRGRVILYQLEWNWDGEHNTPACVDEVWNCDPLHAASHGFKYVLMGSHQGLNALSPQEQMYPPDKMYDVSLLSYQTDRRQVITQQMKALGLTIAPPQGWLPGEDRSRMLMQSRVHVVVHQREDTKGIAPLRWCLAAAHKLPIITETLPDRGRFGYTHMVMSSYEQLASFTKMALSHQMLDNYRYALHGLLCEEWTFRRTIEANL